MIKARSTWALFLCGCTAHAFSSPGMALRSLSSSIRPPPHTLHRQHGLIHDRQRRGFPIGQVRGGGGMSMSSEGAAPDPEDTLVQYIVVRSDLGKDKGWPLGSVIAQGAHAATKTLWELRESENVKEYCGNVDSMHKVVLGAKSEKQLSNSAEKLDEAGLEYRLWIEQPEGIPTALATMPYPRSIIKPVLKKLPLMK